MAIKLPNVGSRVVDLATGTINRDWYLALLNLATTVTGALVSSVNISGNNGITVAGSPITSASVITLGIGNLTCASAQVAGTLTSANERTGGIVATGTITAANVVASAAVQAVNISASGTITGMSVIATGTLTASAVVVSTTMSAANMLATGTITCGSLDVLTASTFPGGAWTPSDNSGAGLAFSGVNANWRQVGNLVFAYAAFTYPGTGSGVANSITGLPVGVPNQSYAQAPAAAWLTPNPSAVAAIGVPVQNTSTLKLVNMTNGNAFNNSSLSGAAVSIMLIYPAS